MTIIINGMPILDGYLYTRVTASRNVLTEDKNRTLILSPNVVLTFPRNLWRGMGFIVVPPVTGTATLRSIDTFLNYKAQDVILSSGPGAMFHQIIQVDVNSYLISGK